MAKKVMIQIYRGIERDIGVLKEGELGYCTDSRKLYIGTSEGNVLLVAAQTVGDMLKSIYDTDNDGVIDIADSAKKINGFTVEANVPSTAKFTDTVYTHPTSTGSKHIPTGGSSGKILKWSADGTAIWGDESKATLNNTVTSTSTTEAGTANAVKTAYDRGTSAIDLIDSFSGRLYTTSNTSNVASNLTNYTKIANLKITSQYQDANVFLLFTNASDGGGLWYSLLSCRLKQQSAMGDPPVINIKCDSSVDSKIDARHIMAVTTVNTANATEIELYLQIPTSYTSIHIRDVHRGGAVTLFSGAGFTVLPTGTVTNCIDISSYSKSQEDVLLDKKANLSHTHTKSEIGLSSVLNYGIATQAESEAGTSNIKYMTPLTVKQAIAANAMPKSLVTWGQLKGV